MERSELLRIVRLCGPKLRGVISSLDESSVDDLELVDVTTLCSLWAGMGHIYKVTIRIPVPAPPSSSSKTRQPQREPLPQATTTTSIIVKHVAGARRQQQKESVGDRRKAASYIVEANFYEHVAPRLLAVHQLPIPTPLYIERRNDDEDEIVIAMTYIEPPPSPRLSFHHPSPSAQQQQQQQRQVLTWLATLHAAYWNVTDETIRRLGLQPIGTYWHLATRQEEHRNMTDSSNDWQGRLKRAARAIDARLQRDRYQCVVHGDAKDENILYGRCARHGEPESTVYFCDFQYCGKGVPAQDLAYYFCTSCSSISSDEEEEESSLLDFYLQQLASQVQRSNHHGASSVAPALPTRRELHDLMDLAHCDYYRFMCGWGFWGSGGNGGVDRVQQVLDRLDGGIKLASEELYDAAVRREYG